MGKIKHMTQVEYYYNIYIPEIRDRIRQHRAALRIDKKIVKDYGYIKVCRNSYYSIEFDGFPCPDVAHMWRVDALEKAKEMADNEKRTDDWFVSHGLATRVDNE